MRQAPFARVILATAALLLGAPSSAGTSDGSFAVGITLRSPGTGPTPVPPALVPLPSPSSGVCYSRSLSEQTKALVEVACRSGAFLSITAVPGVPFLGVHGGAFRYAIPFSAQGSVFDAAVVDGFGWRTGRGTITMQRLYDLTNPAGPGDVWWDRPLEMRVSF